MTKRKVGQTPAAPPTPKRLKYEEVRDLFLKEPPATDEEALDFFTHLGMFIYGRWQSIAADTADGAALDEDNSPRWNDCTDREFEEIRGRAEQLIDSEVARRRISAFVASLVQEPWGTILKGVSWALWQMWEHFWGAIGLLIFGFIFVWLAPHVAKEMRSAFDETLPQETRPAQPPAPPASENADKQKSHRG